jgi:hypothetical protein
MTLWVSRIVVTLFLGWLTYLTWTNNVDLLSWATKKSKDLLPIHEEKITAAERKLQTEMLAGFVQEAQAFRAQLNKLPLPVAEHNAWVARVEAWLRDNFGAAYAVRFSDFSGMTFYGDGSEKSKMARSLDGRSRRLHEFIAELSR